MKANFKKPLLFFGLIIVINIVSSFLFIRFDLTSDKRFTLSDVSKTIINKISNPIYVDVYLTGAIPADFKKLESETKQILDEFQALSGNVIYRFIDVTKEENGNQTLMKELFKKGMAPQNVTVPEKGKQSQLLIFPWATINYKGKECNVSLLKNIMGASTEDKVLGSIQNLEYAFAEGFNKVLSDKKKTVAIIKGNGETADIKIAKFLLQTRDSYHIAPFTLDSVASNPEKTSLALQKYDLAIIAKPTEKFSDAEKQVLDQYIINGGRAIFLIDQVNIDLQNLYNPEGQALAFSRDLNLEDMFFKYGIRINSSVIKDELGTPIKLATGEAGSQTQFQEFNWKYAPFVVSDSKHPIVKNLGGIKFDFANPIEILKNDIKKTVLLHSSIHSKPVGTPTIIGLNAVNDTLNLAQYQNIGNMPVAVLLEGKFKSVFENRVLGFKASNFKISSKKSQIVVISDGNIIENELDKNGIPVELGYDPKSGNLFDNKDFIQNAVNFLLDDTGIINLRTKDFSLPLLDKEKVADQYRKSQLLGLLLPLFLLAVFSIIFYVMRKKRYAR